MLTISLISTGIKKIFFNSHSFPHLFLSLLNLPTINRPILGMDFMCLNLKIMHFKFTVAVKGL